MIASSSAIKTREATLGVQKAVEKAVLLPLKLVDPLGGLRALPFEAVVIVPGNAELTIRDGSLGDEHSSLRLLENVELKEQLLLKDPQIGPRP